MNLKNIGANVKKLRLKRGLTQFQLAERAEISNVHMSHIETGAVSMSLECLINISNALEVTPDSILLGEYKMSSSGIEGVMQQCIKELSADEHKLMVEIAKLLGDIKVNRQ